MEDGLRGQLYPDNDAVIASVRKRVASACADFYESSIQALVHSWRKCIASGGDWLCETIVFLAENLLYPTALLRALYLWLLP
jgi:hypothetical protein